MSIGEHEENAESFPYLWQTSLSWHSWVLSASGSLITHFLSISCPKQPPRIKKPIRTRANDEQYLQVSQHYLETSELGEMQSFLESVLCPGCKNMYPVMHILIKIEKLEALQLWNRASASMPTETVLREPLLRNGQQITAEVPLTRKMWSINLVSKGTI